ncbi:MAG TPA: peptide deformylase [Candidatus Saccharimonadales bacterium]|nr:peptide deformylase [Candidatus Saccharimonadales bacterium]
MTKIKLITLPNPHLRQHSKRVGLITPEIKKLAEEMINITLKWEDGREHELGVALAAIQVDQDLRIIVVRNSFEDKDDRTFNVLINPEIVKYEGEKIIDLEGCLSLPDIYGKVKRFSKIKVKALDINSKPIRLTAEGFLARIIQHEVDHMKGVLFIDHIKNNKKSFYKLDPEGKLIGLDYEKDIKQNSILW